MARKPEPRARREAVALAYHESDAAPRIVAQGYGRLADRIIEEARRHGVFVHDSPELVGLLMQLDLDQQIPQELYTVIAELLVWVRSLQGPGGSSGVEQAARRAADEDSGGPARGATADTLE